MNSTALDAELEVCQAAGCAVRIDYSRAVMEELRLAALDGFYRLAHGGVEIGGVLFGVRDPDAVKILAHRALASEYAFGPSFTLSGNDRRALESLLASPHTDDNLSGMQPVGWYQSHTRSGVLLSEKDLQVFQQYFPEIWQIALVLRPDPFDPVRAGFFFREPDGSVQAASSRLEFAIKPAHSGGSGMRLAGDRAPADTAPAPAIPAPVQPALPVPFRRSAPPVAHSHPRRRWARRAAAEAAGIAAAIIAVAFAAELFSGGGSRDPAGVSLRALDVGGQLRIDWNHGSRVIQQSRSGALEIEDGSVKVHDELSPEHLRAGSVTYLRTTGNVVVRLLVRGADQSTFTETRRFLRPPVATAAPIAAVPIAAAPNNAGSADRSAITGATDAAPVRREPERDVRYVEPVKQASNRTPRHLPVKTEPVKAEPVKNEPVKKESARPTPAASAPARRQVVLASAGVPRPAESLLPAPPAVAASTAEAMAPFIPRLPPPATLKPAEEGPHAGTIIWTGKLGRGGTIQILGSGASQGHITGGLPGAPIRVQVFPSELTPEGLRIFTVDAKSSGAPEAPGSQNGWNRTVYVVNPRKASEIGVVETPGQQNAWNRLTLRAERGDHSIIVLRWERVPADSAIHAAGNR